MLWNKGVLFSVFFLLSVVVQAEDITDVSGACEGSDGFEMSWTAHGRSWVANVTKVDYLNNFTPLINVAVRTGVESTDESLSLPNVYYLGALVDDPKSTVYVDCSDTTLAFIGFVATTTDTNLYIIEAGGAATTGIRMRLEPTANDIAGGGEILDSGKGWKKGGKGGALKPKLADLIPRGAMSSDDLPTLDIYVDPSYITNVGEPYYIARIMQNLALANTIYDQSDLNLIRLLAIVLPDEDIARSSSQGSILHGIERLRKYTVQDDSADVSMVYSGEIFNQPSLWGWAELGFGCELQQAVDLVNNINTHQVGKAAFALIDLPTLMQRGWIFAHEMSHTIGGGHVSGDPLSDGYFQPDLALFEYVAESDARQLIYESCMYNPKTKAFIDFYD